MATLKSISKKIATRNAKIAELVNERESLLTEIRAIQSIQERHLQFTKRPKMDAV